MSVQSISNTTLNRQIVSDDPKNKEAVSKALERLDKLLGKQDATADVEAISVMRDIIKHAKELNYEQCELLVKDSPQYILAHGGHDNVSYFKQTAGDLYWAARRQLHQLTSVDTSSTYMLFN